MIALPEGVGPSDEIEITSELEEYNRANPSERVFVLSYDVGGNFGRARPATGFSTDLKTLVTLGDMRIEAQAAGVWAPDHHDLYLWQAVQRLRSEGVRVVQALPGAGCGRGARGGL